MNYHGLSSKDLHLYLKHHGYYTDSINAPEGSKTTTAIRKYLSEEVENSPVYPHVGGISAPTVPYTRQRLAVSQHLFAVLGFEVGKIDGWFGPNTAYAIEQWQNWLRTAMVNGTWLDDLVYESTTQQTIWPKYRQLEQFYGEPGTNHTLLTLPYPHKLAWDTNTVVTRVTVNKRCADAYNRVLQKTLDHYSMDGIQRLGLDLFGGCFNDRVMRGGSRLSVHAFAAAFDYDPLRNQLRWDSRQAAFAQPAYKKWFEYWESEGARSLGRDHNYDWMHTEFCQG